MDPDKPSSSSGRKMRFIPKAPQRRNQSRPDQQAQHREEDNDEAQRLLRRLHENSQRTGPKVEKRSSVQVAFGPGASTSPSDIYGRENKILALTSTQDSISSVSKVESYVGIESLMNADDDTVSGSKGNYTEPWNDENPHNPIRIPWKRPHSVDSETLDEAEFGDNPKVMEHDESNMNVASRLGLLDSDDKKSRKLLFFQFPATLPMVKRLATASRKDGEKTKSFDLKGKGKMEVDGLKLSHLKGKGGGDNSSSHDSEAPEPATFSDLFGSSTRCCRFDELPEGLMGKMLVYKSGAVKLQLGETIFDVSPGSACNFHQDVAVINTESQNCCVTGRIDKHTVVTPDIMSLLSKDH